MRSREELEKEYYQADALSDDEEKIRLEVMLDIRELLLNISSKVR